MVALSLGLSAPPAVSGPLLLSGGSVYFGRGCLGEAIEYCFNSDLVIIGMEGFLTDGSSITPTTEFIADLSDIDGPWENRVRISRDAAAAVISQWSGLSGFDFVEIEVVNRERG